LLQLEMLAFGDIVDADVDFVARRHAAGQLFADEEIGVCAKTLGTLDGIVIGEGEEVHAAPREQIVDLLRIVVALATKHSYEGGRASPRVIRVDMQITLHVENCRNFALRGCDTGTKVVKMQILN
jgi:hypothetical protein